MINLDERVKLRKLPWAMSDFEVNCLVFKGKFGRILC